VLLEAVDSPDAPIVVLDLGTGLRMLGMSLQGRSVDAVALLTHLHWDHVQGLPFFAPLLDSASSLHVFGPRQESGTIEEAFERFFAPPHFPVRLAELAASTVLHELWEDNVQIGPFAIAARPVPHPGPTLGFRVEYEGSSVVYVPDYQQPPTGMDPSVLALSEGADILIHDAQYLSGELETHRDWGHCTVDHAVDVAAQAGVRTLVLFHHDPSHDDATMDQIASDASLAGASQGVPEVLAAREGMVLELLGRSSGLQAPLGHRGSLR
jgi:phosphoribosyl 1,2-cyclic phosphodiesterase